jgi:hypothetical protein
MSNSSSTAAQTGLDHKLALLVAEWKARPFEWGTTDCCQFARAAAWRLHGIVVEPPAYRSEREALRTIRALGGYTGLLQSAGLLQRPALAAARRGDFVTFSHLAPGLFTEGLALVTGVEAHATTRIGLIGIGRRKWLQCWGVA